MDGQEPAQVYADLDRLQQQLEQLHQRLMQAKGQEEESPQQPSSGR